jgi:hypothetical protein
MPCCRIISSMFGMPGGICARVIAGKSARSAATRLDPARVNMSVLPIVGPFDLLVRRDPRFPRLQCTERPHRRTPQSISDAIAQTEGAYPDVVRASYRSRTIASDRAGTVLVDRRST